MTYARCFKISSYCLIGSGYAAIAATGSIGVAPLALFCAALVASWFLDTAQLRARTPHWVTNGIAIAYIPVFLLDYLMGSRSLALSIIHMVFFMASLKILTLANDRDYLYMYLISFAELLAASTLTIDLFFAAAFLVYLAAAVCTLMLFEMRRSNARALAQGLVEPLVGARSLKGTGLELFARFPARSVFVTAVGMTLMIALLAIPLFFLLPRATLGFYSRPGTRARLLSGFSDRVELGTIGTIKESDTVVMRVKTGEPPDRIPADLKWRGIALDRYDGRTWSRSSQQRRPVPIQGDYFKVEGAILSPNVLWQTFYLEAFSTDVIFASHRAVAVSRDIRMLLRDMSDSLYAVRRTSGKQRYLAASDRTPVNPALIPTTSPPLPAGFEETYLQLPPLDPRIHTLAREITAGAKTPYQKARALESYLRTHYGYTLDLRGTPNSPDPVAMFLFEVRAGHCEYFASAMALMLRQIGVPARLVNGFRAGEYNRFGDDWTVRQYDAHSWVEAYFPPYDWVEFDPTPAEPQRRRSAIGAFFSNLADAVDLWWWEDVVNYDLWKQYRVLTELRSRIAAMQARAMGISRASLGWLRGKTESVSARTFLIPTAAFALGLILAVLLRSLPGRTLRRRVARRLFSATRQSVIRSFYADALDALAARGFTRHPDQTPLEFSQSLAQNPIGPVLADITALYNCIRFSAGTAGPEIQQAATLLTQLRLALRR
jgi:protein-glutamine gamma-glutamyltransferase